MTPALLNPRFWIPIFSNGFLSVLITMMNTSLSPLHIYLFLPGVFPLFLAFNRPGPSGWIGCALTGFFIDAMLPVPMGLFATIFACVHAAARVFNKRIHRENLLQFVTIAFLLNIACWIVTSIVTKDLWISGTQFIVQFSVNLLISQIVLVCVAWWFFEFQAALLRYTFGIHVFEEDLT